MNPFVENENLVSIEVAVELLTGGSQYSRASESEFKDFHHVQLEDGHNFRDCPKLLCQLVSTRLMDSFMTSKKL